MSERTTKGLTVSELGEFELIELIAEILPGSSVIELGPGDDAALVTARHGSVAVSTDLLIEGRHFRRDWSTAFEIGRKCAAANLSDINAMGGVATVLTIGLGLPGDTPVEWVVEFAQGIAAECDLVGAAVAGGDLTAADAVTVAVTVIGDVATPISRAGARSGDIVAVAGTLGLSGAGLQALSRGFRSPRAACEVHRVPHPPYAAGPRAALAGATAMIDTSDGLLADLGHIARASKVRIDIHTPSLEVPEAVATVAEALGGNPLLQVLTGGEDFALAATFPVDAEVPDGWLVIGQVLGTSGGDEPAVLVDGQPWEGPQGHRHWSEAAKR